MTEDDKSSWFASGDAYEHYVGRWSRPVGELFLDWLARPTGLNSSDIGCGTGALTETILNHCEPNTVLGIEPSEAFLASAQQQVADRRASFKSGDALALPIADNGTDVVVSGLVLNFIHDKTAALMEMQRIVKPGGMIAAYVWDYAGQMQLMRYFWDAATDLFPDAAEYDEGLKFPICKPDPLAGLFLAAGLKNVATKMLDTPTVFTGFDDYWSPFLQGQGPAGAYCAALSAQNREKLAARLKDTVPFADDGSIAMIARAWAVRGTA